MSQGGVPGFGSNQDGLRASDADRERIVEQLRRHAGEGRLTMDEFEERMSAAYEARTYGQLAELTRDLPVELGTGGYRTVPPQGAAQPFRSGGSLDFSSVVDAALQGRLDRHELRHHIRTEIRRQVRGGQISERGQGRSRGRQAAGLAAMAATWAGLSALLTGIWFLVWLTGGGSGDFWPVWPIGILGLLTALRAVRFFGDRH